MSCATGSGSYENSGSPWRIVAASFCCWPPAPRWAQRLSALGWAGRIALTNYLIQIAILDWLSSGYGVALRIRPALVPLLAAVIVGIEVGFSRLWLARFRLGPAEWLWRSFTYGKLQPMKASRPA